MKSSSQGREVWLIIKFTFTSGLDKFIMIEKTFCSKKLIPERFPHRLFRVLSTAPRFFSENTKNKKYSNENTKRFENAKRETSKPTKEE